MKELSTKPTAVPTYRVVNSNLTINHVSIMNDSYLRIFQRPRCFFGETTSESQSPGGNPQTVLPSSRID